MDAFVREPIGTLNTVVTMFMYGMVTDGFMSGEAGITIGIIG